MSPQKLYGTVKGGRTALGSLANQDNSAGVLVDAPTGKGFAPDAMLVYTSSHHRENVPERVSCGSPKHSKQHRQRDRSRSKQRRPRPDESSSNNGSGSEEGAGEQQQQQIGDGDETTQRRPRGRSTEGVEMISTSTLMKRKKQQQQQQQREEGDGGEERIILSAACSPLPQSQQRKNQREQEGDSSPAARRRTGEAKQNRVLMSPGVRPVKIVKDPQASAPVHSSSAAEISLAASFKAIAAAEMGENHASAATAAEEQRCDNLSNDKDKEEVPSTPIYPSNINGFLEGLADGLRMVCRIAVVRQLKAPLSICSFLHLFLTRPPVISARTAPCVNRTLRRRADQPTTLFSRTEDEKGHNEQSVGTQCESERRQGKPLKDLLRLPPSFALSLSLSLSLSHAYTYTLGCPSVVATNF